eukprot:TRINITY_DN9029_c0_g1_i1.p1 TRINITY_DN9029_c0_g1~~TRINITY_DN9029_c0_g1_i1.p1  ORF type:complete len:291 (+),score=33.19 TRINITY_DN9029_c0_g1_i1:67-939(+)
MLNVRSGSLHDGIIRFHPCDASATNEETHASGFHQSCDGFQQRSQSDSHLGSISDMAPTEIPMPRNIGGFSSALVTPQQEDAATYHEHQQEQALMWPQHALHGLNFESVSESMFEPSLQNYQLETAAFDWSSRQEDIQYSAQSRSSFRAQTIHAVEMNRQSETMVQRQYHKTKLCRFNRNGRCFFGDRCKFAHSVDDLQVPPSLAKTKLCINFSRGQCFDKDCNFAHGYKDLRSTNVVYKSSPCPWFARNLCRAGSRCRYAHTFEELREARVQQQVAARDAGWADGWVPP